MNSPDVQQLSVLSERFAEVLGCCRPASVAVLGVAGGNGLEHVDSSITRRVVGLDINPTYLEAVATRYSSRCNLELHCVNLSEQMIDVQSVELVHAALVFEHAGTGPCLENAVSLVAPGGVLSIVLQLPSEIQQGVSPSRFSSIGTLKEHFQLVDPVTLSATLEEKGFRLEEQSKKSLPAGKAFWMAVFRKRTLP